MTQSRREAVRDLAEQSDVTAAKGLFRLALKTRRRAGDRACVALALAALAPLVACDDLKSLDFRESLFRQSGLPVPGSDEPYPNLASVPPKPAATDKAARTKIAQTLTAENKGDAGALAAGSAPSDLPRPPAAPALPEPPPPGQAQSAAAPGTSSKYSLLPQLASPPSAAPKSMPPLAAESPASPAPAEPSPAPGAAHSAKAAAKKPSAHQAPRSVAESPAAGAAIGGSIERIAEDKLTFDQVAPSREVAIVLFARRSQAVDRAQERGLAPVAALARGGGRLFVIAFEPADIDAQGQPRMAAGQELSLARAQAVAEMLVRLGVPVGSVAIGAVSEHSAIVLGTRRVDLAGLERVEVYLEP